MKKITKLILLLLVSMTVDSKNTCINACPVKPLKETGAKLRSAANSGQFIGDENDWILNTRFKY